MKKICETQQEVETLIEELFDNGFLASWTENQDGKLEVVWTEQKNYVAFDGQEYPDEAWITKDGEILLIQDMSEAHAKNALRMMVRNERMRNGMMLMLREAIANGTVDGQILDLDSEPNYNSTDDEPHTLH